jgi:5-methyltetrahydrofolate--homocysteine methyltransferase
MLDSVFGRIKEATVVGDMKGAIATVDQALSHGVTPAEIIQKGFIEAMSVVGKKFKNNEIYLPEMLIAAKVMKTCLEKLKALIVGHEVPTIGTIVLGTVKGDLHDIGKNLAGIMMEGAGLKVIDLGIDIPPEKFAEAIKTHRPQFLGLSALLTTTMAAMRDTIRELENLGLRKEVKILVGGAPITQKFADEIGADGYADNAAEAADTVKAMLLW